MSWTDKHAAAVKRKVQIRMKLERLRQKGDELEHEYVAVKDLIERCREHMEAESLTGPVEAVSGSDG